MGSISPSVTRYSETFSQRGQNAIALGAKRITWDIVSDMWHPETNCSGYLSVGMAENTLLHDTLLDYIHSNFQLSAVHLTYNNGSMGSNALRKAVAHFLNRHFQPFRPVEPVHVLMTNGCSSAIEHLSWTFLNPGDAILLSKPYYSTFIADISLRPEAVVVPVEMGDVDPLSPEAVDEYENAAIEFEARTGRRVRAVMLCNPHNPLGRCYPRATVDRLMRFCQSRQMHLISDEIYALSVWNNRVDDNISFTPFESLLSRDTTGLIDPDLVHVLWIMSKDFGANGLRVGAIISQANPELHVAQKSLSLYSFTNRELLSQSHEFLAHSLRNHQIEYTHGSNAGFFLWINLGKKYLNTHPEVSAKDVESTDFLFQKLLNNKVYVAHGLAYGSEKPGWFRVVFAHPIPWLEEAMARIIRTIQ
ncbi:putative aminotransferase, classes I and II family [Aspergillus homomorphus CBS 101889]|uniref:1-aminocyclopropane-1-carboxylate synthase n=1 Tax=Aspergillus homomorphus (strain CBS 101889) TaxID=1450537 RepID=A0A395HKC4_ASPHC|nr:1-aminocyclopropane-1-carboxylate synthase [Aspergillus homomorphus CBS 101889]RAL08267.1 1-aminocyclopropane-1-carboxylate synthase [Aspergillus homomorphus CBS 101889]